MLHTIYAANTINFESECHYAFCEQIDDSQYPQVHDFYEITLVVQGSLQYQINQIPLTLKRGDFLLARPGDIHSKISCGPCQHINLAFPQKTIDELFAYLYSTPEKEKLLSLRPHLPVCHVSHTKTTLLQEQLSRLHFIPLDRPAIAKTALRKFLLDVMSEHIMPAVQAFSAPAAQSSLPPWLLQAVQNLNTIENLSLGMDYLTASTGHSTPHICRSFKKFLHITPNAYINAKRLNYAANMLAHTDRDIVEIAYDIGFSSISYFYKLFKSEFGLTPREYRLQQYTAL